MPASSALVGVSDEELREFAEDQAITSIPGRYAEFLKAMGRAAGPLLVGTDAFYPDIIGLKRDGLELLADSGVAGLASSDVIVIAMHQGYQVYWMADVSTDDPPVYMYQEGDKGISKKWDSLTEFLRQELAKAG